MNKPIKILVFGDINGKIGRKALIKELPKLKKKYQPTLVIANCENLAHGFGITPHTIDEMTKAGINFFTSGNHIFDKPAAKEIFNGLECPIIRPANYKKRVWGSGEKVIKIGQNSLLMVNLMGRVFIKEDEFTNPFKAADLILKKYKSQKFNAILFDFHAEATSEKVALGHYLNGRASALWGTHTHIQTADEKILDHGTAYITDLGMVGDANGVIGVDKENVIKRFLYSETIGKDLKMNDTGKAIINGLYLEINPKTAKTIKIKRINILTEIRN